MIFFKSLIFRALDWEASPESLGGVRWVLCVEAWEAPH